MVNKLVAKLEDGIQVFSQCSSLRYSMTFCLAALLSGLLENRLKYPKFFLMFVKLTLKMGDDWTTFSGGVVNKKKMRLRKFLVFGHHRVN